MEFFNGKRNKGHRMIVMLDVLLFLALASTITGTVVSQQPTGPEGQVGGWVLLVFPWLFLAIAVFILAGKGSLNFIPGGRPVHFFVAFGILVTFGTAMLGAFFNDNSVVPRLLIVIPLLILAGCAGILHHSVFPNPKLVNLVAAIFLAGAGLVGWGLTGTGIFLYMKNDLERSARQAQEEREQEEQREQWEVAEYAKLDDSVPLNALLRFAWSRNDQVRREAREKASRFPGLDDKLIELIDQDCDQAISYIAKLYENPPAMLAPSWGEMLERQLTKWDGLQYDEHAGTWEHNLKAYFEGAQKIQLDGGSLRTELLSWHKHLQKCNGLGDLTAFVKTLL
jgi:hypothetical protein